MKFIVALSLVLGVVYAYPQFEWDLDDPEFTDLQGVENRIANGQLAEPNQFPYQVRLSITKRRNGKLVSTLCGGGLISNSSVLTAAHCLDSAVSALLFMGTTKTGGNDRTRVMVGVWQRHFVIHERWNSTSLENDIAVINFPAPIKFNEGVQPVNLPRANLFNLDNRMAVIAGFGKTGTKGSISSSLRFARRRILPSGRCVVPFRSYFKSHMHLCVDGSENISTCPGDSGGPLVVEDVNGTKSVVGLTSFGGVICDKGLPVVFTRVTAHLPWIHKHTGIPIKY